MDKEHENFSQRVLDILGIDKINRLSDIQEKLLDNNFVLLKETKLLSSPLGMLYYHFYDDVDEVNSYCEEHKDSIQCRVGAGGLPFGTAQSPKLNDYADNVDTMQWLNSL